MSQRENGRRCTEPGCDRPHEARGWCSLHYRRNWRNQHRPPPRTPPRTRQRKAEALIEDVEWLITAGESPNQVAKRFGVKPGSVARRLDRWGRVDLGRPFWRAHWHERAA